MTCNSQQILFRCSNQKNKMGGHAAHMGGGEVHAGFW
jgi:hypothetical protein